MVKIRNVMKGLGIAYASLYGIYALAQTMIVKPTFEDVQNPKIQEVTRIDKQKVNWFRDSASYLIEDAHRVTNKFIEKLSTKVNSLEESLDKREGHCKHCSIITYSNFRHLAKKINPDCINDARLSWGQSVRKKFPFIVGHCWVEMKEGESWVPYETTRLETGIKAKNIKGVFYIPSESIRVTKDGQEEHLFRWGKVIEPIVFPLKLVGTAIYDLIH